MFNWLAFARRSSRARKGHDEVIYKDAWLNWAAQTFLLREKQYEITHKGFILPHYYYADFIVWDTFEGNRRN